MTPVRLAALIGCRSPGHGSRGPQQGTYPPHAGVRLPRRIPQILLLPLETPHNCHPRSGWPLLVQQGKHCTAQRPGVMPGSSPWALVPLARYPMRRCLRSHFYPFRRYSLSRSAHTLQGRPAALWIGGARPLPVLLKLSNGVLSLCVPILCDGGVIAHHSEPAFRCRLCVCRPHPSHTYGPRQCKKTA